MSIAGWRLTNLVFYWKFSSKKTAKEMKIMIVIVLLLLLQLLQILLLLLHLPSFCVSFPSQKAGKPFIFLNCMFLYFEIINNSNSKKIPKDYHICFYNCRNFANYLNYCCFSNSHNYCHFSNSYDFIGARWYIGMAFASYAADPGLKPGEGQFI